MGSSLFADATKKLANTDRLQRGVTFIELLIVMAIIGILASIAMPHYQNYTVRARISEALYLSATAKIHVLGVLEAGHGSVLGYNQSFVAPTPTKYVASVTIAPATGVITILTTPLAGNGTLVLSPYTAANTGLPNATSPFLPPAGAINWQCMAAGVAPIVAGVSPGTVAAHLVPGECR